MKTVLAGAGLALAAGLLMGAAAKPQLNIDDRPEGPQILTGPSGARSTGPVDHGATFAGYNSQIPDYVLGTDWKRSPTAAAEPTAPEPRQELTQYEEPAPTEDPGFTHAPYYETPHAAPSFPSMEGGVDLQVRAAGADGVTG